MVDISYHPASHPPDARFSILIPTWNNLPYLELCIRSLQKHSVYNHQIILHINEGSDGSLEWARQQGLAFTHSPDNVGICFGVNAAASLADTEVIVYWNDDMVACPGWDEALLSDIEACGEQAWFVAATLIEPSATGNPCVIDADFGSTVETFQEDKMIREYSTFPMQDQQATGGAANAVPRWLWHLVGGYSIEYTPGWNSDPDFAMKLWQAGVRYFKTVSKSRAYHFHNKTGKRVGPRNAGRSRFVAKWGLTSSKFMKHFMKLGQPFQGLAKEPEPSLELKFSQLRGRLPGLFR